MLNVIKQCLLNVVFSMTKAFHGKSPPKQKGSIPPTFQCYLENTAFLNACFKISSDHNPVVISWLMN